LKNRITISLIIALLATSSVFASSYYDSSDFTGESFFTHPDLRKEQPVSNTESSDSQKSTTPPIKQLRLKLKQKSQERRDKQTQLAPTDPDASIYNTQKNTSDYASKEIEENFDENMMPDGFEADDEAVEENKKAKHFWNKDKNEINEPNENTENIILDCDNMDYDTENYCLYATGNVNVEFVKQQTIVKADKITYDRANNTIKAEGNVKIIKNGQIINGDYIFVDLNEESALIENPVTRTATVEVKANKGYVYGDKIVQEQGSIVVNESYPINFRSTGAGPQLSRMIVPKEATLSNDMDKGLVKVEGLIFMLLLRVRSSCNKTW